jgi:hypothetical protein
MHFVQDQQTWVRHVNDHPEKVYGFLLCADEHTDFKNYIKNGWCTLNTLSGTVCDIFYLIAGDDDISKYPDTAGCFEVRDKLFGNPEDIILPGLALFPSAHRYNALYYGCAGLTQDELSSNFQRILNSINRAYRDILPMYHSPEAVDRHFYEIFYGPIFNPEDLSAEILSEHRRREQIQDFRNRIRNTVTKCPLSALFKYFSCRN